FTDQGGIDLVGLVTTELGAGEVPDLGRVDHADDVTCVVQRQCYAKAMTPGRFHADVGLFAAYGLQPGQQPLPAIRIVLEGPGLLSLASRAVCIQGVLGHIDSNYRVTHFLLPFQGMNTARLRVGPPCTRDQRSAASLDTVRHEQRSSEKRGHIYPTGSLTKGGHEAHRFPCCSARYCRPPSKPQRTRGASRDATPPTPPGIRVRTTAVRRIKRLPAF